jgi:hypothetical protein
VAVAVRLVRREAVRVVRVVKAVTSAAAAAAAVGEPAGTTRQMSE